VQERASIECENKSADCCRCMFNIFSHTKKKLTLQIPLAGGVEMYLMRIF